MQQETEWNALPPADKACTLADRAHQARRDGQDQAAYGYYVQSLHLYRGMEDRAQIVRSLIRLSYLAGWADFGDGLDMVARRQKLAAEALPLAREVGDQALLAEALSAFAAGETQENALVMLEESVRLAEASGNRATLARALSCLGNCFSLQGDLERARTLQEQALGVYQEIEDKAGMANVLFILSIRAEKAQRRDYLEQALALQRELGAKKRLYEILTRLEGMCAPEELDRREAYLQEALQLCREFGSPIWEAGCLKRLAQIARTRGNEERAEALETESRSMYEEPEINAEAEAALQQAFASGDTQKIMEALKQRFK